MFLLSGLICAIIELVVIINKFICYSSNMILKKHINLINCTDIIMLIFTLLYVLLYKINADVWLWSLLLYPIPLIVLNIVQNTKLSKMIDSFNNINIIEDKKVIISSIIYAMVYLCCFIFVCIFIYYLILKSGYFSAKGSEGMGYLFIHNEMMNIFLSFCNVGNVLSGVLIYLIYSLQKKQ